MSWLYFLGVYLGIAVIFSLRVPMRTGRSVDTLRVPMRTGRSVDTLQDVRPGTKVVGGLLWPVVVIVWAALWFVRMFR